jgi:hypothetical protein
VISPRCSERPRGPPIRRRPPHRHRRLRPGRRHLRRLRCRLPRMPAASVSATPAHRRRYSGRSPHRLRSRAGTRACSPVQSSPRQTHRRPFRRRRAVRAAARSMQQERAAATSIDSQAVPPSRDRLRRHP